MFRPINSAHPLKRQSIQVVRVSAPRPHDFHAARTVCPQQEAVQFPQQLLSLAKSLMCHSDFLLDLYANRVLCHPCAQVSCLARFFHSVPSIAKITGNPALVLRLQCPP